MDVVYKPFSKVITIAAGTTVGVELRDSSGVLLKCNYAEVRLSDSVGAGKYMHITPSSNTNNYYLGINTSVSAGATTSGAPGLVIGPGDVGVISAPGPITFNSLVLRAGLTSSTATALITYGVRRVSTPVQDGKIGFVGG